MSDLVYQSATQLAAAIRTGSVTSTDVVEAFLAQIATRNPALNAVVTVNEDRARQRARQADKALATGEIWGALHGVPVTIKDAFETAGLRTTAGHKPLAEHIPAQDATVVARLRGAGAIVLGKTNLPELAMDIQSDNALFGATKNPWDPARTPGGSSGGEAAALAAGLSPLGIGSDIGGSVRIPAHFCGVFGLKPTEGRVPFSGHIPPLPGKLNAIRHLAAHGPLARSAADLRLCLQIISGPDGRDPDARACSLEEVPARPIQEYRFAWTDDFGGLPVSTHTRAALRKLADDLANAGCHVERATPRDFDLEQVWKTYGELFGAMAFASFPRVARVAVKTFGRFLFKDVISRSGARGATTTLQGYFEILQRRDELIGALEGFMGGYDAWLCPVTSAPAFPHRKRGKIHTPIHVDGTPIPGNLAGTGYTCPFNLTGNPVVVTPLGVSPEGLPLGVQVVGHRWGDMPLLNVAEALSQITGPFRRPPGF